MGAAVQDVAAPSRSRARSVRQASERGPWPEPRAAVARSAVDSQTSQLPHRGPTWCWTSPTTARSTQQAAGTGCSTCSSLTRPPGSRSWRPEQERRGPARVPARPAASADDRWRHRHGSPGHGRSHVMPALVPPYATVLVLDGGSHSAPGRASAPSTSTSTTRSARSGSASCRTADDRIASARVHFRPELPSDREAVRRVAAAASPTRVRRSPRCSTRSTRPAGWSSAWSPSWTAWSWDTCS